MAAYLLRSASEQNTAPLEQSPKCQCLVIKHRPSLEKTKQHKHIIQYQLSARWWRPDVLGSFWSYRTWAPVQSSSHKVLWILKYSRINRETICLQQNGWKRKDWRKSQSESPLTEVLRQLRINECLQRPQWTETMLQIKVDVTTSQRYNVTTSSYCCSIE